MHLNDDPLSLYDVLELTPDATPQEIRSAYLRLKSAYSKDNIAHYTVFSREDTETMLQNIENAYMMLSNPERRRHYDQNQGLRVADTFSADAMGMTVDPKPPQPSTVPPQPQTNDLEAMIQNEENWNGAALRRMREARRISLEDLSDYTRISRIYLQALEDDDFNKLPALVYVRGFLQQVSRRLKLPADAVSASYLARLKSARPG
jgi:curved DNA-binding protein CbpA